MSIFSQRSLIDMLLLNTQCSVMVFSLMIVNTILTLHQHTLLQCNMNNLSRNTCIFCTSVLAMTLLLPRSLCCNTTSPLFQEVLEYHHETYMKAVTANQVVSKIYGAFRQWFFTMTFCEFTYFENRLLKYTENMDSGYPVLLLNGCPNENKTRVRPRIDKHGQTAYVITSSRLDIEDGEYVIRSLVRTGVFKPRSAVIFVLNVPVEINSYFFYSIKVHFQLLWSRNIANSVLILWSGRLRVYSYNPFSDEIEDITKVNDISKLLYGIYNNLYGHELRLDVFRKSYVSDETGPVNCNTKLATTVMKRLNATCKPLSPRDGHTVGDLLDNGTATGVTADLIEGYADLELGSKILQNTYYGYIDTTYPLLQDELCFLVKKAEIQATFTTTMKLISTKMLLIFIVNVIVLILIGFLAKKLEKTLWNIKKHPPPGSTILTLFKCFIRQSVEIKYMGPFFRCVAIFIIIYSLIINCFIDGVITSAVIYPRYSPDINTLLDLQASNLTLGIQSRHIRLFREINDFSKLNNPLEIINDKKTKEAIDERNFKYAILMRKSEALYISKKQANMQEGRPLYHTMQECPLPCFIVYGLRYGSPYLLKLNNILYHLYQGGILQYWIQTEEFKSKPSLYENTGSEVKPLSLHNLYEVFAAWLLASSVCILVFIIEVLSKCTLKPKKNFIQH